MDELGLGIDEEYDLNEIESRLYSQVFHGSTEDETETNAFDASVDISSINGKRRINRYFGNRFSLDTRPSLQLTIDNSNQVQTRPSVFPNLTVLTQSNADFIKFSNEYENITNQYRIPVIINTDCLSNSLNVLNSNYNHFENLPSWNFRTQILTKKQKNLIRSRRKKECQKLKQLNKNVCHGPNKKIIFISDDSDDECVLTKDNSIMACQDISNSNIENEAVDSDDDIIYIPPPPIQIINVDEEEAMKEIPKLQVDKECPVDNKSLPNKTILTENKSPSKSIQEFSNTAESTSNDFLDNPTTENTSTRFNFALHGSDFTNNSEFQRPNTLVDFCETESSCSTNDHNRDFNNSAKSIVFDEVEFPKEDIFSDKNLDSFSTFITPKRNDKNIEVNCSSGRNKTSNILLDTDSSTSSTESDYESSDTRSCNKDLPTLSPMISSQALKKINNTPNSNKKKLKETNDKKNCTKRKSSETGGLETQFNNKSCKKKKKLNKNLEVVKNSIENNELKEAQNFEEEEKEDDNCIKKKKRKKSYNLLDKSNGNKMKDMTDSVIEGHNPSDLNISSFYDSMGEKELVKKKKRKRKKSKKTIVADKEVSENNPCLLAESLSNTEDPIATEAIQEEHLVTPSTTTENVSNIESVQTVIDEKSNDKLYIIEDPNDITLYNEPIKEINETVSIQNDEGKDNDDVIVIDQKESRTLEEVIVLDDMSDSSDVELIESVNFDCVDLSNLELGNFNTTIASTSTDICNLSLNDGSMDYFNSFDVKSIQSKQSDDPQKWLISYKDRNNYLVIGKKGPRCSRCRHFGHIGVRCPDKPYPPCCTLCSDTSHQEPRCPNKVCRQCGNPGDYSTSYCYLCFKYRHVKCNLCNVPGHVSKTCPDLWRRYHLTTEAGPIIMPNQQVMRPRNQQWCSGCAQQGHLEHECNNTYYHREFPPTRPDIVTYIDILNENNIPRDNSYIPDVPKPTTSNNMPLYSFPIMNNLLTINTNSLSPFGRTITPNALNSNIIIQVPNSCVQQNVLTPNLIDQMRTNFQNSNISSLNTNIIQQMNQNFQNSVLPVGETISSSDPSKFDMKKIQELFMSMPHATVKSFVKKQIEELDTKIVNYNPKVLRHKLFKYDRLSVTMTEKTKKDRCFWFRVLNMFIFGIHNLNDGKLHIRFIRNFLASQKSHEFDESKRRSLFSSYSYIFGVDKHSNISYYRLIKLLVDRCNEGKVKPL